MRYGSILTSAMLLALTPLTSTLCAATLDVPGNHATIQAAIDSAVDGDVVLVQPGTYAEVIDFNGRSITVRSSDGAALTTIDGSGFASSVVTMTNDETDATVLEGFTITGGNADGNGGGIFIEHASPTIRECVVTGNLSSFGGGIFAAYADDGVRIERCVITDNSSQTGSGGGVVNASCDVSIDRSRISGNSGTTGGGMLALGGGTTLITNSLISGNVATGNFCCSGNGGGGYQSNQGMTTQLVNVTFTGNRATTSGGSRGGAVHIGDQFSPATIANCIFFDNDDAMGFADISDPGDVTTVSNCVLQQAWSGVGGANMVTDPFLIDPDGLDDLYGTADDSPYLAPSSPCINAGDVTALPAGLDTCLVGNSRVIGVIDIGAMEFPEPPCDADLDDSGAVDFTDLLMLLSSWGACAGCPADVDGSGAVDFSDLLQVLQAWGPCA